MKKKRGKIKSTVVNLASLAGASGRLDRPTSLAIVWWVSLIISCIYMSPYMYYWKCDARVCSILRFFFLWGVQFLDNCRLHEEAEKDLKMMKHIYGVYRNALWCIYAPASGDERRAKKADTSAQLGFFTIAATPMF